MSYTPNPQVTEGGMVKTDTSNITVEGLLSDILVQLKIMNLHLAVLSDNHFKKTEVD